MKDHHAAYITWEEFERNQRVIVRADRRPRPTDITSERIPAIPPRLRERVKVPRSCRSRYPPGSAQMGGFQTFAAIRSGNKIAPQTHLASLYVGSSPTSCSLWSVALKSTGWES